jgi:hypothetical protein
MQFQNVQHIECETENSLKKDTPHSELRFRTELNQNTSNSGHSILFHIMESTNMVRPVLRRVSKLDISSGVLIIWSIPIRWEGLVELNCNKIK